MIRYILLAVILFLTVGCGKENTPGESDYRTPYTGLFGFTMVKSTMVMCYDTTFPCNEGWKEIAIDTNFIISFVQIFDTNRVKIHFGDSIIGIDDRGDTVSQTFFPILSPNGDFALPEYPIGGHNYFTGFFKGYDTIEMVLQFGYGIGGYDKYKIVGIREF